MSNKALELYTQPVMIGHQSGYHTVLTKFFFTNPNHVPNGIPEVSREEDEAVDRKHVKEAYERGFGQLASVGKQREGRVDTGMHFADNLQLVQAGCLITGLSNAGYRVTHCHWFFKRGDFGKSNKFVVVVGANNSTKDQIEVVPMSLNSTALEQRRALSRTCWQWMHGWANPNGVITLNFGGRMPDGKARNVAVVRDWHIGVAHVVDPFGENDE